MRYTRFQLLRMKVRLANLCLRRSSESWHETDFTGVPGPGYLQDVIWNNSNNDDDDGDQRWAVESSVVAAAEMQGGGQVPSPCYPRCERELWLNPHAHTHAEMHSILHFPKTREHHHSRTKIPSHMEPIGMHSRGWAHFERTFASAKTLRLASQPEAQSL